jgi:hypothetical protein
VAVLVGDDLHAVVKKDTDTRASVSQICMKSQDSATVLLVLPRLTNGDYSPIICSIGSISSCIVLVAFDLILWYGINAEDRNEGDEDCDKARGHPTC